MKARNAVVLGLALLACFADPLPAPTSLLEQMRAKIIASQPFRADFVQQVLIEGEMSLEESGYIVFAHRNRIKWQYVHPENKTFILENGRYQFYDRENKQLLKGAIDPGNEQIIWDILCSSHPGQGMRWQEKTRTIALVIQNGPDRQEFEIRLTAEFLPERVVQTSAQEVTTVYSFRNYRARIALAADEFRLELPDDVEIIENE